MCIRDRPVTVADSIGSVTCTVTGDSTVPANGTLTVTYRCELGAVPTTDVVNTATISWSATDYIAAGSVSPITTIKASAVSYTHLDVYKRQVVSSTGHTDSAYKVIGSITVTNPNTWQPVTLTGLSDQLGDGTSCTILTGDVPGTLPASGSATFTYECVYACLLYTSQLHGCRHADRT